MNKNAVNYALIAVLGLRLLTAIFLVVAVLVMPVRGQPEFFYSEKTLGGLENSGPLAAFFLAPWYRWDSAHYLELAENGYTLVSPERAVWPPAYPFLIRLFSHLVSPSMLVALLISTLSLFVAFYILYNLVAEIWEESLARKTLLWMVVFPTGYYLVAAYSESLFLAFALGSLWAGRHRRWWLAGLLGVLAVYTRNLGVLLVIPLLWQVFAGYRGDYRVNHRQVLIAVVCVLMLPCAQLGFFVYQHYARGFPWPWHLLSTGWNQSWAWPWEGLMGDLRLIFLLKPSWIHFSFIYDLIAGFLGLYLLLSSQRDMPVSFRLYAWVFFLPALMKISNWNGSTGISRYILVIFPIFVLLAQKLNTHRKKLAWFTFSIISQELLLLLFYKWIWVA